MVKNIKVNYIMDIVMEMVHIIIMIYQFILVNLLII